MFSWLSVIWQSKIVRDWVAGAALALSFVGALYWMRDQAADKREDEVRAENERKALKQRIEIGGSQNEQVKEADTIRRGATPTDVVPKWMEDE